MLTAVVSVLMLAGAPPEGIYTHRIKSDTEYFADSAQCDVQAAAALAPLLSAYKPAGKDADAERLVLAGVALTPDEITVRILGKDFSQGRALSDLSSQNLWAPWRVWARVRHSCMSGNGWLLTKKGTAIQSGETSESKPKE
ncbi:MAG: hypothetical protein AB1405_08845 [Bdellovibrionota bacterium]